MHLTTASVYILRDTPLIKKMKYPQTRRTELTSSLSKQTQTVPSLELAVDIHNRFNRQGTAQRMQVHVLPSIELYRHLWLHHQKPVV